MRRLTRNTKNAAVFFCALLTSAAYARAQAPAGSEKLSPQAVAESLVVLKQLDSTVRKNPNDAATWYRRGMVAWALSERAKTDPPIGGLDWTLLGHLADTSLRIAAQIPPKQALYGIMSARYILNSGVSITRMASYAMFDDALKTARESPDKTIYAEAAVEAGRVYWRRYDTFADRWMAVSGMPCDSTFIINPTYFIPTKDDARLGPLKGARIMRTELLKTAMPLPFDVSGETDYLKAAELFKEAFEAQPSFQRGYQQYAMLLVEKNRWTELGAAARLRVTAAPWDAWAWLTLGLARHRAGDDRLAAAAFDSGFTLLPPTERKRLDQLERILPSKDSARIVVMDSSSHATLDRWYWRAADPLWAQQSAEPRIEFLARVTHAELRWTVEEMHARGADTDRGQVFIRYGPPDLIAGFGAELKVCTLWVYNAGLVFRFEGMRTFATAQFSDYGRATTMIDVYPVRWDNIELPRIDSIPTQAARFRAHGDSVDVFIAGIPPVDSIKRVADVAGAVRVDAWFIDGAGNPIKHDSTVPALPGMRMRTTRLAPGVYVYRSEASSDGSRYAGRSISLIHANADTTTGFAVRGFGMSDVVIASGASSRGTPARWSDLTIQPVFGRAPRRSQLSLIWENYEVGNDRGNAKYAVAVSIERERSAVGRIAAQFVGRVGSAVGIDRDDDRVVMHFERTVAFAPALLENITVGLGDTPAGPYRLTVSITDHVTGRTTSRTMNLTVTEPAPNPPPRR